jgi:hypothetical protein
MRLQKLKHSKYKGTEYYKFVVNIPNDIIEKLGWVEGEEVSPEVRGRTLTLRPLRT